MSFKNLFGQEVQNPDKIILVINNAFKNNKHEIVYNTLKGIYPPIENTKSVIIGVMILSLPEGSNWRGQFQLESKYY